MSLGFDLLLPSLFHHDVGARLYSQVSQTMAEQRLTRQALITAECEQHCQGLLAEVHRQAPNEHGQLGVNARPNILMELVQTALDTANRPAEMPVRVLLSSSLVLALFQAYRLSIEGAYNGHGLWEPLVDLLDNFFLEQFRPFAERPQMREEIEGHHQVLRDIRSIRENHPWFRPPPEPPVEEEAEAEEETEAEEEVLEEEEWESVDSEMESSVANTSDEEGHAIVHQHDRAAIRAERRTATAELDAFHDWLDLTGRRQIRDEFSNFLWGEHRAGRYPYPPRGR